jgi:hypothetical protein
MPIYPLQRVFYPQNRPCTPKIVGTFYMQGYKVKEKTAIVPHCTPSFKTQWAPWDNKMIYYLLVNCISGVIVSMLTTSVVDCRFEPRSSQTKHYEIGICFSVNHGALRCNSKDWLAHNQDNMSEWIDRSSCRLLFQWTSIINIQFSMLV